KCACTSRPITGSQLLVTEMLVRFTERDLDVLVHLDHRHAMLQHAVRLDQPELPLAGLELELHFADEGRARAVEHAWLGAEHPLHRRDEIRSWLLEPARHDASLCG